MRPGAAKRRVCKPLDGARFGLKISEAKRIEIKSLLDVAFFFHVLLSAG
jgi:hypothetical protein